MAATLEDIRYKIKSTSTLGWASDETARQLLEMVTSRAEIILKRRKWVVVRVEEFYPKDKNLLGLNVNKGELIQIRLRPPHEPSRAVSSSQSAKASSRFFSFERVMCTMLHEMVHCIISPHNAKFWATYYELVQEAEAMELQSFKGGRVLGSKTEREADVRDDLLKSGAGRVLGGTKPIRGLSPAEQARQAALGRITLLSRALYPTGDGQDDGHCRHSQLSGAPSDDAVEEPEPSMLPSEDDANLQAAIASSLAESNSVGIVEIEEDDALLKYALQLSLEEHNNNGSNTFSDVQGGLSSPGTAAFHPTLPPLNMSSPIGKTTSPGVSPRQGNSSSVLSPLNPIARAPNAGLGLSPNPQNGFGSLSSSQQALPPRRPSLQAQYVGNATLMKSPFNGANLNEGSGVSLPAINLSGVSGGGGWTCPACTFVNKQGNFSSCEMCNAPKPGSKASGPRGSISGPTPPIKSPRPIINDSKPASDYSSKWRCHQCAFANDQVRPSCEMCGSDKVLTL